MTYNPYIMEPPDDPRAVFCYYCGEGMDDEDIEEAYETPDNEFIHIGCLPEYTWAVEKQLEQVYQKIEKMVERGLS